MFDALQKAGRMRAFRWLLSFVVLVICGVALRHIDWDQLQIFLRRARFSLLMIALLLPAVHGLLKSERWRILLSPFARPPWLRLYHTLIMSFAASAVLPARAGELLRLFVLKRQFGVPVSSSIGVIVVEKLLEMAGLLLVVGPLLVFLPLPHWISVSTLALGILVLVGIVAVLVVARFGKRPRSVFGRLAEGVRCIATPRRLLAVLGLSVLVFVVDGLMITLVLRAYEIDLHWAAPALVLLPVNIAIALPSTPAQIGIFEAAAVAGLTALGVNGERALAFAMTYHIIQIVPVLIAAGLTGKQLMRETRQKLLDATQLDSDGDGETTSESLQDDPASTPRS